MPLPASESSSDDEPALRLTVITARYESTKWKKQIESSGLIALQGGVEDSLMVERIA